MGHSFDNTIVNLNHPYSDYGFLRNQESVNGGTEKGWDGFDLLEIQSTLDLTGMEKLSAAEWKNIDLQHLNKTIPEAYANQDMRTDLCHGILERGHSEVSECRLRCP